MNPDRYVVWRNGRTGIVPAEQLRMMDFVLTTGRYLPSEEILRLQFQPDSPPNLGEVLIVAGVALGAAWLLAEYFSPRPQVRRIRRANREPVEAWKKDYVSERDRWRCTYCQRRVSRADRHIDHSVSRSNGGSNHINNLRTACRDCNLEKGALNARQFRPSGDSNASYVA